MATRCGGTAGAGEIRPLATSLCDTLLSHVILEASRITCDHRVSQSEGGATAKMSSFPLLLEHLDALEFLWHPPLRTSGDLGVLSV